MTANGASAAKTVPSTTWPHACNCALLNASVGCGGRLACSAGGASGKTIGRANTEEFGEVCSAWRRVSHNWQVSIVQRGVITADDVGFTLSHLCVWAV